LAAPDAGGDAKPRVAFAVDFFCDAFVLTSCRGCHGVKVHGGLSPTGGWGVAAIDCSGVGVLTRRLYLVRESHCPA